MPVTESKRPMSDSSLKTGEHVAGGDGDEIGQGVGLQRARGSGRRRHLRRGLGHGAAAGGQDLLELAVGLAQPYRLLAQHADRDLRVGLDHVPEGLAADDDQVAGLDHLGLGGAGQPLQDRHLAEEVALLQDGQGGVAVLDPLLDGHAAGLDDVHVLAVVPFVEEDVALGEVREELREGVLLGLLDGHCRRKSNRFPSF
jgi:hypothetical protein